jgi:molybdopterin-guanine dinucleotide biosynthesis protein A
MTTRLSLDAIIVAGGRAHRLGGIDKTALVFEGRSLLQRSLDAVRLADRISVVGYDGSLAASTIVRRTAERPRWGGPAAALVAGLESLRDDAREFTVVVAGDMPRAGEAVSILVAALHSALPSTLHPAIAAAGRLDGVVAVDSGGHPQPLLAVYRTSSLSGAAALHPDVTDLSMRRLIAPLDLVHVPIADDLCADVDTPQDAAALGIEVEGHPTLAPTG